jgi:hypothetical protein
VNARTSAALTVVALTLFTATLRAQTVAIVTATPAAEEAARHLASQLEGGVTRRVSVHAEEPILLMNEARARWPEDLVVVLDADRAMVRVLRPWDGTVASRSLDPEAAEAPYAMALAAAELLEIVENAPPADAASLPPRKASRPVERPLRASPAISVGALQSLSADGDIGLLQPTVGVDVQLSRQLSALWYHIGLHAAGVLGQRRVEPLVLPGGPDENAYVVYNRDEVSLRAGPGHRYGNGSAAAWLGAGLSRIHVTAFDQFGNEVESDARFTGWLGLGGELRYGFIDDLAMAFGGGLVWLPSRSRFFTSPDGAGDDTPAFEEGSVEVRACLAVVWEGRP